MLLGAILRFFALGSNPPSLDWDEVSLGYNAYSILKTGADEYGNKFPLSIRSFDDFKPPLYVYLTIPSVALFGLNEFAVRLPAAFFGTLTILVVYFLVQELLSGWNKKLVNQIALVSAFFIAISPWHLQFSRAAFEGNIGMFFLITALLFFFKAFKNPKFAIVFAVSFVLSMYAYHSFRLIDPLIFLCIIVLFWKEILKNKLWFGIAAILIIITSIPIYSSFIQTSGTGARLSMVTIFSDPKLQMESAQKVQIAKQNHDILGQILYNRRVIFIPQMIKGYFDHFNFDFLFLHGDGGVQHHAYNMGMLYLWDFAFIVLGFYMLVKRYTKRIILLSILFFIAPLPAAITSGTPHPVRAIMMIPVFQIFAAVGIVSFAIFVQKKYKELSKIFIGIVCVLLFVNVMYYIYSYFVLTPIHYGYFWQYGNKEAIEYAKANEAKYSKVVMTYMYDQPYIYYLFYNQIDPAWYQKNWDYTKTGEVYRFYRKIGKYEFENINFDKKIREKNTLLIAAPHEVPENVGNVLKVIKFPDGRVAYKIIST